MQFIAWTLFFLLMPAVILTLTYKNERLSRLGAIVITYAIGLIIGNIGVLPEGIGSLQEQLASLTVPVALPLIFFSLNLTQWRSLARRTVISLFCALFAVSIGTAVTFFLFAKFLGPETWKVAGMLVGVYTGGTPNLAAIGTALNVDSLTYVAVHGSDVVISSFILLLLISVFPKLFKKILPPFTSTDAHDGNYHTITPYFTGYSRREIIDIFKALGLALLVFAAGGSFTLFLPEAVALPAAILTITTLGIAFSFVPAVRRMKNSFQLGYYLILIFSLTVSSMANVQNLVLSAPVILLYVGVLLILVSALHLLLSALFRIDVDTHIITATAFIFSPPFVPVVAAALRNKEVVVSGILTGVTGWVIGNYLGVALAYALKGFLY
ncbi:MAG: DUF819 family protein [Spirochaetia bacterium]|nr:DUF819 family protein [Spirochaetia bacterium]